MQTAAEAGIGQSSTLTEISVYPNFGFGYGGGGIGISPSGDTEIPQLNPAAVRAMWSIPGVQAVIPTAGLRGGATLEVDRLFGGGMILGVDPRLLPYMGLTMQQGEASLRRGEVLVGAVAAENFFDAEETEYRPQVVDLMAARPTMILWAGRVALLVAAFGVANTMTMAILERTREIGLMKAIGARDRDILTVFLCEAGLVGLLGSAAGLGVSYLIGSAINSVIASMPVDPNGGGSPLGFLGVNPAQLGGGLVIIPSDLALFALAMSVGITARMLPSLRAARMLTVQALRAE